jgi:Prp8 binding protein
MLKRGNSDLDQSDDSAVKRSRVDGENLNNSSNITTLSTIVHSRNTSLILRENASRISSLPSPELNLTGHEGAVYSLSFDPTGKYLCSGSLDRNICK